MPLFSTPIVPEFLQRANSAIGDFREELRGIYRNFGCGMLECRKRAGEPLFSGCAVFCMDAKWLLRYSTFVRITALRS